MRLAIGVAIVIEVQGTNILQISLSAVSDSILVDPVINIIPLEVPYQLWTFHNIYIYVYPLSITSKHGGFCAAVPFVNNVRNDDEPSSDKFRVIAFLWDALCPRHVHLSVKIIESWILIHREVCATIYDARNSMSILWKTNAANIKQMSARPITNFSLTPAWMGSGACETSSS